MRKLALFLVLSTISLFSISAGPFGLEFGMSLEALLDSEVQFIYPTKENILESIEKYNGEGIYSFGSIDIDIIPPAPSDLFPFYSIEISETLGLYEIEAYEGSLSVFEDDKTTSGNADNYAIYEYEANEIFDRTYNALVIKYGYESFGYDTKYWYSRDNNQHLDITLSIYESATWKDFSELFNALKTDTGKQSEGFSYDHSYTDYREGHYNGLYRVSLTYNQEEYLQALLDSDVL